MLAPKKVIHRKVFNRYGQKRRGMCHRGSKLEYGDYGLQALSTSWVTSRQIEAARRSIAKRCKGGRIYIRIFPHRPVTAKGLGVPMGSGGRTIDYFMFPVKPGRVLFEVSGVAESAVREAFRIAAHKLPVKCRMISKNSVLV